ncbi:MAG: MBL fold metallo-hydrolase [Methanobacteriaceae archaeon]|nr:MBL fold metallo-hydrolase [Methanobacteriaceae archaeon]
MIPLAFESLGVRSMCTFVQTDQNILIDPGTSIAPKRFQLPPSKKEWAALKDSRGKISEYALKSSIITISHYHHDHFTPFETNKFLQSSSKIARKVYTGKRIFLKNPNVDINKNQSFRAKKLLKNLKNIKECEINYSDDTEFHIGKTHFKFSPPLPHGAENSPLGYIIGLSITYNDKKLLHASDVQGPISNIALDYILNENPDKLILSGPPLYLLNYAISSEDLKISRSNLDVICQNIKEVVIDHHLLRSKNGLDFIENYNINYDIDIGPASYIIKKEPILLESDREKLIKLEKNKSTQTNFADNNIY